MASQRRKVEAEKISYLLSDVASFDHGSVICTLLHFIVGLGEVKQLLHLHLVELSVAMVTLVLGL